MPKFSVLIAALTLVGCVNRSNLNAHLGGSTISTATPVVAADGLQYAIIDVDIRFDDGTAVRNADVTVALDCATCSLTQPARTDEQGHASALITSTSPATVNIHAAVSSGTGLVAIPGSATTTFTTPISLARSSFVAIPNTLVADGQHNSQLVLTLKQEDGEPIVGEAVLLNVSGEDNVVSASRVVTDGNGVWSAELSSIYAETKVATVDVGHTTLQTSIQFLPSGADSTRSTLSIGSGATGIANGVSVVPVVVVLRDAYGNAVSGATISMSSSNVNSTVSPQHGVTDANGIVDVRVTSSDAGSQNITATAGTVSLTGTILFTAPKADVRTSTLTASPLSQVADGSSAITFVVTANDADGVALQGCATTFSTSANNYTLSPNSAVSGADGRVTAALASTTAQTANVSAIVDGNFTLVKQVNFSAGSPAAALSTFFVTPSSQVADGSAFIALSFNAKDAYGNAVSGQAVSFTGGTSNIYQPAAAGVTDSSGVFNANITNTLAQVEAIVVTAGIVKTANVTFVAGNLDVGHTSFSLSPNVATADGSHFVGLAVHAADAYNNPITGQAVTFSTLAPGVTFSPASIGTTTSGVFNANAMTTTAQSANFLAQVASFSFNESANFTAGNPNRGKSSFTVLPTSQTADGSSIIALTVSLNDTFGNPVANTAVTFSTSGTGHTWSPAAQGNTNASGVFNANLTSTVAEVKTLQAATSGISPFAATATFVPGPPTAMTLAASPNTLPADGLTTSALTARVVDAWGNGVPGQAVSWYVVGAAEFLAPPPGATGTDGRLAASLASPSAGLDTVVASSGGLSASTRLGFVGRPPFCSGTLSYGGQLPSTSLGVSPHGIAMGDFNGDGKQDLATTNYNAGSVGILLGAGNGTFAAVVNYGVGTNPDGVVTSDFNGDGKQDLAVSNYGSNNVSILLGAGDGTFGTATNNTLGTQPRGIALGDFNADGKQDLVVANYGSNTLSVLSGVGNGTFGIAASVTVATNPYGVAVGDFNGDGKQDLVAADYGSTSVSVMLGVGNSTFGAATSNTVGTNPRGVTVGDFNGDSKQDLAVANYGSASVSILLGAGNGTFAAATSVTVATNPQNIVMGDLNADGKQDLIVTNYGSNSLSVLTGGGTGTFTAASYGVGTNPYGVVMGDLNGDSKQDLAVANYGSNNISVLLGTITVAPSYPTGANPYYVAVGDFNGDGNQDLVTPYYGGTTVGVLLGTGNGAFAGAVPYAAGTNPLNAVAADFNGDSKQDLAVANYGGNNVSILLGAGNGTFGTATNYTVGNTPNGLAVGDFNGDGKLDLASPIYFSAVVSVILGAGNGSFGTAATYAVGNFPSGATAGDFNGDGKLDLIVSLASSGKSSILLGVGNGTFSAATNYTVGSSPSVSAVGDFNGDGNLDFAVACTGAGSVYIGLGAGNGTFAPAVSYTVGNSPNGVAVGDYNGDGQQDLTVVNRGDNSASILLGVGDGTFGAAKTYAVGASPVGVAAGDFNHDGKQDFAVANVNANSVSTLIYGACVN